MIVVHDVSRPDVNGKLPLMHGICEQVKKELSGLAPYLTIETDDNLMSCIDICGSFEPHTDWKWGMYYNSTFFMFSIKPKSGKRYYNENDIEVVLQTTLVSSKLEKIRKTTGTPKKIIEKLKKWISDSIENQNKGKQ